VANQVASVDALHRALLAGSVAVDSVAMSLVAGVPVVRVTPEALQAAAQPVIDAFDWSDAAQAAREAEGKPERTGLRAQAAQAIEDLDAFLALTNPTNAQTLAIVRKLCQQNKRIIARLIQVD
jgi:hypothetical protein